MLANLENWAMVTGQEKVIFIPILKKGNVKECQTTTQLHSSHMPAKQCSKFSKSSTVRELRTSRCSSGFRKGRGTRDQIPSICWIIEKAREFQKNIYFCFIDYIKAFGCVDTTNWKILKEMGIPDHCTCLPKNL